MLWNLVDRGGSDKRYQNPNDDVWSASNRNSDDCSNSLRQSIGGGAPPSIETDCFEQVREASLEGNLLRHRPASDGAHYLQDDPDAIGEAELVATDIWTGDKVLVKKAPRNGG